MATPTVQHQLALDVWQYAYDHQRPLNLGTVERRLAILRAHNRGCGMCSGARQISARALWPLVRATVSTGTPPERPKRMEWPADMIFAYSADN